MIAKIQRSGWIALAILTVASPTAGQVATLPQQPVLGSALSSDVLRDLPSADDPFVLPDGVQSEVIGDRLSSGGLNRATAPRFGAFLNSWTQTQIRIGDINITDPRAGGTPLLLPALPFWQRMTMRTGAMGVDDNASALSMVLDPQRPGAAASGVVEGSLSGPGLVSDGAGTVPFVDQLRHWQNGSGLFSGPVSDRLGLVAAGSWRSLIHQAARNASAADERVVSGLAHLVFAATPRDEIRALGWAQRVAASDVTDTAVHVQSTWERHGPSHMAWRVFGGYTERSRTAPVTTSVVVDSLTSDPVPDIFDTGAGTTERWALGARLAAAAGRRLPTVGVDLEGARVSVGPTGIEQIRELVDGAPARLWVVHASGSADTRHLTTFAAFANEQLTVRRVTLEAGVRLDVMDGSAEAAMRGIQWTTWLPRTAVRWRISDKGSLALAAGYRRSAYQLPLNILAIGDPAAPVADVSNWNGTSVGPLIARVGPGTAGDASLTQIDPQLRRPMTDEVMLSIESSPKRWLYLQAAGIAKRETPLLGYVDVGLPSSAYMALQVPDPSFVAESPQGAPVVTAYDRPAGSYGKDQYLLTNQAGNPATFWGVEVNIRVSTNRFLMWLGGTIWTKAVGPAAAVGFLPTENDQDLPGNMLVDPNGATQARGQLFPDRSHTGKMAAVYRFPWGVRLGAIVRYQDGQPFARVVIVPGLTQGPTAVRAYQNGGTAFTYTGTLDIRLQKSFAIRRSTASAIVDVYNLPNLANEVSEYVVGGPRFRSPTALQPPRTAFAGVRVAF